jgi:F-type H+-transporting ATPase subunit a
VIGVLAADAGINDPFKVPPVGELFNFPPILFQGTLFEITRVHLVLLFGVAFLIAFFLYALRKRSVVPSKIQLVAEMIAEFVREQIAVTVIGTEGVRFVPFLTTVFVFVLVLNWFEVLPFVNFPPTSKIAIPMFLAAIIWLIYVVMGFVKQGWRYPINVAFPPGVPKAFYILIAPIELISFYIVQPITLTVRLFANMFAGHILLVIVFLVCQAFLFSGRGTPVGIFGLIAAPVAIGFEILVGALQAYIMTILAAVYFERALHAEH